MTDAQSALDLIAALCPSTEGMRFIVAEGAPKSKARPRVVRTNVYTPSSPFQKALAIQMLALGRWEGNIALGAIFYRPSRQRIDTDNMLKLVLDAGTQANIWGDDSQVTALLGIVHLDRENPRTVIAMGNHESTLVRATP